MENLKTYLLEQLPFFNAGFTGIFLDYISGKLISYNGDEVGISDKNGNSFYIREKGDQAYRIIQKNAPKIVETTQDYKMVVFTKLNISEVKKCVLNALFFYKNVQVLSASVNAGQILSGEYPRLKDAQKLPILKNIEFGSLLSVDFRMSDQMVVNNCKCEICEQC